MTENGLDFLVGFGEQSRHTGVLQTGMMLVEAIDSQYLSTELRLLKSLTLETLTILLRIAFV